MFNYRLLLLALLASGIINAQQVINNVFPFDKEWRFYRGGVERGEFPAIDDSKWRTVDLPHDWSIEDLPGTSSPFNPDAISQVSGGFTTGGTGWYRKRFAIPEEQKGKHVILIFDGVYMNADVWLNGQHLGNHPYGYTSFYYDITDKLKEGQANLVAVQVKNEGQNSRWYSGSGINRHAWLKYVDPVHIAQWGVSITTPVVTQTSATINIKADIENDTRKNNNLTIVTRIYDAENKEIGNANTDAVVESYKMVSQDIVIRHPILWSTSEPYLYRAVTKVYTGNVITDSEETNFGIRTISVDAANGFLLNGKPLKLKGACYHNDNGPLGSRSFDRAEERRVELLKASGFNAIRCSHNPPAPAFLNACDRQGILVIDETFDMWKEGKNPYDYHLYFSDWWQRDVASMVMRDRNHPSVVMWSIGNEIPNRDKPEVVTVAKSLADYIRKLDPSRPITSAVNDVREDKDPYFELLDVSGYNYAANKYNEDHVRKPTRVIMATESYPFEAFDYWMGVKDNPYVIGDFVWTGFDYIGEASIGWRGYYQEKNFYPWNLAYCGDIDICGWKRPQSYYRDVLWKPNQLSIFVTPPSPSFPLNPNVELWSKWNWNDVTDEWNWKGNENKALGVSVYSSCDEVELFLNNKSLGKKATNRASKFIAQWQVPFNEGTLRAVGYANHKKVNVAELHTAGEPVQIKMSADRKEIKADEADLSYITVELADGAGIRNPNAENLLKFTIEGPATIVGVGNANPMSVESYQLPERKAWKGRCLVIIKSGNKAGKIILKASADNIGMSSIELTSR